MNATPHILHIDEHAPHLHWAPGTPFGEVKRAGTAVRAFLAGSPILPFPGYFRFGVDDDGNALIGGRLDA